MHCCQCNFSDEIYIDFLAKGQTSEILLVFGFGEILTPVKAAIFPFPAVTFPFLSSSNAF